MLLRHLWTFIVFFQLCSVSALQWAFPSHLPFISSTSSCLDFLDFPFLPSVRWGEARHPGPSTDWQLFGFSNPSGLRQKEDAALSLGPGVWSFSETQLSHVTQRSCAAQLRHVAASQHRQLRVHFGAPVTTRATSTWAGTWSGVATISDHPSQEILLPYAGERDCGRLLTTRHLFGNLSVTNTVIYGYPKGPTWPDAYGLTTNLLGIVTTEIVLGGTGPRLVGGDFNAGPADLSIFALWRQLGWQSAQDLAEAFWGQQKVFTCKHATERDMIWLSPEAIALCRMVDIADVFAEHSTITVGLHIPRSCPPQLVWQRPSPIPWDQIDPQWASSASPPSWTLDGDADTQWAEWASSFEKSLHGHVLQQPGQTLHKGQRGRLQHTKPQKIPQTARVLKPSRPSEVQLRNDFIGSEVKQWFRQLRRLQSYQAAILANKLTSEAITYRLELWMAIKKSPGFLDGFATWWTSHRTISLPETPAQLPVGPPSASLATAIFQTFKCNFEHFERWHLKQRGKLLQSKFDKGMQGIFQDLKKPQRDRMDFLVNEKTFAVLATDETAHQIHLDAPIFHGGFLRWSHDGQPLDVEVINEVVLQVPSGLDISPGDVLTQHQLLSDTQSLHQQLLEYWKPTWCALAEVDQATWARVTAFFQAYVPRLRFDLQPISIAEWRRALKKYGPHAARGVDGISPRDLLELPVSWTQRLLDLLHAIELGQSSWPTAVLYGIVSVLAKDEGAQTVSRFRPVVIFSVLYRTWASIRAKQLLRILTPHMDVEAFGFMPGCESTQLWLLLQAEIECSLQTGQPLCGLSTDLTRAFNFIPRQHTFTLAQHLGVPTRIISPWRGFLASCTRAFEIRGVLSDATCSTCGMPEGDALSVFGMTQLCFAWHLYMRAYCPAIRSMSFVDNLSLLAAVPGALAHGLACLVEFFKLWNLAIDRSKSYCWALTAEGRQQMAALPLARVDHAHELGGVLSFTKRRFTGLQQKRIASLPAKWKRLQHSRAPLALKLAVLPSVFWTSALYGINGSCMGELHIDVLRRQALRSLRLAKAGVNALLRLGLSSTPAADPGFWRLRMTVRTFLRLLGKEPRLLGLWTTFMLGFDGTLFSGPFSQLLVVLNQIGWKIVPPFLLDHDGCSINLLCADEAALDELLYDAWLQHIARSVSQRKTMNDLKGLDPQLLVADTTSLTSLQRSWLDALRSGAFMDHAAQSHFDMTKSADCRVCGVSDDTRHWLVCPRFHHERQQIEGWQTHHAHDTTALMAHLLPSRSPFAVDWKQALLDVPCALQDFLSAPGQGTQHVFTDGSATCARSPYQIAAWGSLNSTTGEFISMGHVPGLRQTSDRAELLAVMSTLAWQQRFQINLHLWIDSKFGADGLLYLLAYGVTGSWANMDLWLQVEGLLQQIGQLELTPHWIPSHLDTKHLECPFEDWVQLWNDRIDVAVGRFNLDRSEAFLQLRTAAIQHYDMGVARLRQLRAFYFAVASKTSQAETETSEGTEVSLFGFVEGPQMSLFDLYIPSFEGLMLSSDARPSWPLLCPCLSICMAVVLMILLCIRCASRS